jgi:exosome complex component RRP43
MGDTKVVAGVTLMVGQPSAANPNMGEFEIIVSVGTTCNPRTSPYGRQSSSAGGQDKTNPLLAVAASSEGLIHKTVVEAGMLDLRDLCIVEGQRAWNVLVEVVCLNYDGNLIDASLLATVAALSDTTLPCVATNKAGMIQLEDDPDQSSRKRIPLNCIAVSLTFSFLRESAFADPKGDEEISQHGSLTVVTCESGKLISVSKSGGRAIASKVLAACINLAIGRASQIHALFRAP